MGAINSIYEAKNELANLGVYVGELELIDWNEIFEYVPNSDQVKNEIEEAIYNLANSVKKFKEALK